MQIVTIIPNDCIIHIRILPQRYCGEKQMLIQTIRYCVGTNTRKSCIKCETTYIKVLMLIP